jgi:hypothetical protein
LVRKYEGVDGYAYNEGVRPVKVEAPKLDGGFKNRYLWG